MNYKNERTPRQIIEHALFGFGINYSDSEIQAGNAKMLINFDVEDRGRNLMPRKGLQATQLLFNGATVTEEQVNDNRGTSEIQSNVYSGCSVFEYGNTRTEYSALGVGLGKPFGKVFMNILRGGA